jgi:hypothetical protein
MTFLGITAIFGGTFFFFHNRDARIHKEAQIHIDNLFSLSGKLSAEEKQAFVSETQALVKILEPHYKNGDQSLRFISDAELARIQKHTMALVQENPELAIHHHGPGEAHQHVYETDPGENDQWISEELANINATIEEVKASNASASAKEALLSVLEHRRSFLMNHEKDNVDLAQKFQDLREKDPTIIGVTKNHITGEYTPHFPNMLTLTIHSYTREDGTVGDMYVPTYSHATDPEVAKILNPYLEALETLPPSEVPPPPEHKDLQLTIEYAANYRKEIDAEKTDESLQTPEQFPEQFVETSEDTSTETDRSDASPDPIITAEEVDAWQRALENIRESTDDEMAKILQSFEDAIGIPIDRLLEMTDAEIEDEFSKYFSEAELEKQMMPSAPMDVSIEDNFDTELRRHFSPKRVNQAMQTLERYGPEEGLRKLKAVDPEMSTRLEQIIHRQKDE